MPLFNTGNKPSPMVAGLIHILGPERVRHSPLAREMYAFDSSPFSCLPDVVAFPETTAEVAAVVGIAGDHGVSVMPRGAGTCLSGGAVPVKGGISLSLTRMNRILDIDPFSRTALVEPGVVNLDLQKALAPHGLMFPPDPASQKVATIGGNVAECAGGIQGARYGVTKNYVQGLELVLADGSTVCTGLLSQAETMGPDMTGIFNGSEGAFAVITKILVSLRPVPQSCRTALAAFPGLGQAARAVSGIISQGIIPTALELMDQAMLRAVDDYAGIGFPEDAEAVLLMEVDGFDADLDRQLDLMARICRENGAADVQKASGPAEREDLWRARRSGNGALGRIRPAYMVHDVTVPRNHVAALLTRIRDIGICHNIIIAQMAHAGDGNAHPHLLYYPDEPDIDRRLHDATADIFRAALELGGTISGEHGIGLEKQPFMGMQFSGEDLDFMEKIRACLDPHHRLNPGKILPAPKDRKIHTPQLPTLLRPEPAEAGEDNGILEFIPDNLTIKVRGETPLHEVQAAARGINAWVPLDTGIHGNITLADLVGQGAKGRGAMAWGSLREYIFGLELVTPSGQKICTGGHTAKNVAGFDFTRLPWKARGTLGRIETLTLKLVPRPESEQVAAREFPSLSACLAAAREILVRDIALCTLKAVNRPGKIPVWTLAAVVAGSSGLAAVHVDQARIYLDRTGGTTSPAAVHGNADAFWDRWHKAGQDHPVRLATGRGTRRPMFHFLETHARQLDGLGGLRLELDLGYPGLELFGPAGTSVGVKDMFPEPSVTDPETHAGFYIQPDRAFPQSPLYNRINTLVAGDTVPGKGGAS
ncbi:MAG: FAD-linked oxidase C-terminal domain-containing protein [Desulfobacter sp.]